MEVWGERLHYWDDDDYEGNVHFVRNEWKVQFGVWNILSGNS